jgi:hypothetical protein
MNYKYITDFHGSRKNKIGASDVPYIICHPENTIESLAAYTDEKNKRHANTAIDLYYKKINNEKSNYSYAAKMGHVLEPYIVYEFISDNFNKEVADEFLRGYLLHKIEQDFQSQKAGKKIFVNPLPYNTTPFRHNTEASNEFGVAHIDTLFDPEFMTGKWSNMEIKNKEIDITKPLNIQAKSCNYFSFKSRKKDKYKGYDISLKEWEGLPLGVYFQVQFEMLVYNIDTTYVALNYNTNQKASWKIKANKKHQKDLMQLAKYMKQCIDTKTPPKQLAINQSDIIKLYGSETKDDFIELELSELDFALKNAKEFYIAKEQEKKWKRKKEEAEQSMSIFLKDFDSIKGVVDGEITEIAKWKETGGSERICGLSDIKKRDERESKRIINYLTKNNLIKKSKKNKKATIKIKEDYLENI